MGDQLPPSVQSERFSPLERVWGPGQGQAQPVPYTGSRASSRVRAGLAPALEVRLPALGDKYYVSTHLMVKRICGPEPAYTTTGRAIDAGGIGGRGH